MNLILDAFAWLSDPAAWGGPTGVWWRIVQHLGVTGLVVLLACLIALPIGIAIGHTGRWRNEVTLATGAARAVPTLGVLTLLGLWLGIGLAAPVIALLVLAIPPMLAGTYSGIASANPTTIDGARAIGLTEAQIVSQVELPAALPIIMGGLRSTVLQVIATATLAAYTADVGLGRFLYTGLKTRDYGQMIGGAIVIVVLALACDLILARCQSALTRRADPSVSARPAASSSTRSDSEGAFA